MYRKIRLFSFVFCCQGTDEPVVDDMQRLEQQAQAVAAKDVTAKLKEKVLFVRFDYVLVKCLFGDFKN